MRRDEPEFLYLTTTGRKSGQPRRIEIWFTERQGRYYLVAEHREKTQWVQNVRVAPQVHVEAGDRKVDATARVVDALVEPDLHRAIQKQSEKKYGWGDGLVVELTPTAAP